MAGPILPAFSKLSALLHTREAEPRMDNLVLRLHYRVTARILLLFAFVVSTRSLAGEPIECTTDSSVPRQVMNSYCYVAATFSGGEARHHSYYQWVPFVFALQALTFYMPFTVWKHMSGNVLRNCFSFQLDMPDTTMHGSSTKLISFAGYLSARMGRVNQGLVKAFFVVEFACLLNVIGNIFLLDAFLGVDFGRHSAVRLATFLRLAHNDDSADTVFPPVAKCTFLKYGYSGTIERIDAVCVLPHNVFNEKLFVFLWLWISLLAAVTVAHGLFRVASLAVPKVRRNVLLALMLDEFRDDGRQVFEQCTVYDWFLLCNIAKRMDTLAFSELVHHLAVSHKELLLPVLTAPGMSRRASQWSEGHRRSTDHPKVTP
ncbi:innexin inx2-like [Pollicipes pollicipes]|uniref:innexin inx2-like n=1 Tax=Pollicipes pollicipes TaxID=41117 RepID=UPI0018857D1A|nr:innexin inx2-like [Pollicipes pollicipes]